MGKRTTYCTCPECVHKRREKKTKKPKLFNGKPISHWEKMAHELVVYQLVRAATSQDHRSLPDKIAQKRLMELARSEDSALVDALLEERNNCQVGLARVLKAMMG